MSDQGNIKSGVGGLTEEQIKALEEKLKQMSPEELKAFQKQQCIFCQIVAGRVASKKVYEDNVCIAILDINPANPGHLLLLPKEHYPIMPLVPKEELEHMGKVAKHLSHCLLKSLKAEGVSMFIANGVAAGQRAQHFMIHLIPRKEGDGVGLEIPMRELKKEQLAEIEKRLKGKMKAMHEKK